MTAQDLNDIRIATYRMCQFGLRAIIITMLVGIAASFILIGEAYAASLKSVAVVNDDVVRLGDIFDGVEKADTVLGAAPKIGKDMVLSSSTLRRVANIHAIAWSPQSASDQVVVKRASQTIDAATIQETIKSSLAEKGIQGTFSLEMTNASDIVLPANVDATAEVASLNYTPGRDVFTATIAVPSAENPVKTTTVSGLITRMVSVPVLNQPTRPGEIISASDIIWMDVPERSAGKDVVADADQLIGKTPSRVLTVNKPIRFNEIVSPQLVSRGDDVTILYEVNGMILSARGKSMQNGSEGDLIRVTNLSSNRSMSAQVSGDRIVKVQ